MFLTARRAGQLATIVGFAALLVGCRKPSADDHVRQATTYIKQSQLREAALELRAAVQIDPKRADIRLRLADVYMLLGAFGNALAESVRAADLLPNSGPAQLRAGNLLLLAHSYEDAKARAYKALSIDAKSPEALVLLGNAMTGLKDLNGALSRFQEATALNPNDDVAYQSLGAIQAVRGKQPQAEATFKKAVQVAPKSVEAHMGLANYLWATGRVSEAEVELKTALSLEPANVSPNRALALLCLLSDRAKDAEPYFETIAKTSKTTEAYFALADYYAYLRRYDESSKVLREIVNRPDAMAGAQTRLAAIDAHNGQRPQALAQLAVVVEKYPKEMPARLLRARLFLEDGKRDEALAEATAIVRDEPSSVVVPDVYMTIGSINVALDRAEDAVAAYGEVLKRQPQSIAANVELSSLHFFMGSLDKARTYAQAALDIRPGNALALCMMVRIDLAQGHTAKARQTLDSLATAFPKSPQVLNLLASQQFAERKPDAARATYNQVLRIVPANIEATAGLVQLDLDGGRPNDAVSRIDMGLKTAGQDPDFLVLAARTYGSTGQGAKAEDLLKKAIEIAPTRLPAYDLLGQYYAYTRRLDAAADQFQVIVQRNPKSVGANTMLGMIREAQGRPKDAEKHYQTVLALDPKAAVAANNLAWLYVSDGRNLDQALELASTAQQRLPEEPRINDTLGWIHHQKGMWREAVRYLEVAVNGAPNDPGIHFHLGMAYSQSGDLDKAQKELTRALTLKKDFEGADEAKKTLARVSR